MSKIRVSDQTIAQVLQGEDNLDKMLGFDDCKVTFTSTGNAENDNSLHSTGQALFLLSSHQGGEFIETENIPCNQANTISSSPELSYTPGRSRLDAASLARLKVFIMLSTSRMLSSLLFPNLGGDTQHQTIYVRTNNTRCKVVP